MWGRFSSNSVGATAGRSQSGHLGRVGVRAVQAPLLSLQRHKQRPAPPPPPVSPSPGMPPPDLSGSESWFVISSRVMVDDV